MEQLDVVDQDDYVIRTASFQEIYSQKLQHRIVHVLIFNEQGKMALQLRSKKKSFCPLHWSTAVGGHVQAGETYEQAALREFKEELGTASALRFFSKDVYGNKFLTTFTTTFNGPFTINPEEVEDVQFFSLEEIQHMIAQGEKFHPELLFLLQTRVF